jgi:hypothetical protein
VKTATNELKVKEAVRARDGYRCRECGMTNAEHQRHFGRSLEVHRFIPGAAYTVEGCGTLCRWCHLKQPKSTHVRVYQMKNGAVRPLVFRKGRGRGIPIPASVVSQALESSKGLGVTLDTLAGMDEPPPEGPKRRGKK